MEMMYAELIRDNMDLVNCISEIEINKVIEHLRGDKTPDYLTFLEVLCECDGHAMTQYQTLVARMVLHENRDLVYLTEVNKDRNGVVVSTNGGQSWMPIEQFAASSRSDDAEGKRQYKFLEAQLELFGDLALGRNMNCIRMISDELKYLTWEECFICVQNERLPASLRSKYVELICNMFINVGDNVDVLAEIQLSFDWKRLTPQPYQDAKDDKTMALSGAVLPFFPELSQWIKTVLSKNGSMVASEVENNLMLREVLEMVAMLVRFGYYVDPTDIEELMAPLLSMLDGSNDRSFVPNAGEQRVRFDSVKSHRRPSAGESKAAAQTSDSVHADWIKTGRFESNYENKLVMAAKRAALHCIEGIFNLVTTVRIQMLMYDFKSIAEIHETGNAPIRSPVRGAVHTVLQQIIKIGANANEDTNYYKLLDGNIEVRRYINRLVAATNWVTPGWLVTSGLNKKKSLFGSTLGDIAGGIGKALMKLPGVGSSSRGASKESKEVPTVPAMLLDVSKYDDPHLTLGAIELLERIYSAVDRMFSFAVDAQVLIVPDSVKVAQQIAAAMPKFRMWVKNATTSETQAIFAQQLHEFSRLCELPDERRFPHRANQTVLTSANLHFLLLEYL